MECFSPICNEDDEDRLSEELRKDFSNYIQISLNPESRVWCCIENVKRYVKNGNRRSRESMIEKRAVLFVALNMQCNNPSIGSNDCTIMVEKHPSDEEKKIGSSSLSEDPIVPNEWVTEKEKYICDLGEWYLSLLSQGQNYGKNGDHSTTRSVNSYTTTSLIDLYSFASLDELDITSLSSETERIVFQSDEVLEDNILDTLQNYDDKDAKKKDEYKNSNWWCCGVFNSCDLSRLRIFDDYHHNTKSLASLKKQDDEKCKDDSSSLAVEINESERFIFDEANDVITETAATRKILKLEQKSCYLELEVSTDGTYCHKNEQFNDYYDRKENTSV